MRFNTLSSPFRTKLFSCCPKTQRWGKYNWSAIYEACCVVNGHWFVQIRLGICEWALSAERRVKRPQAWLRSWRHMSFTFGTMSTSPLQNSLPSSTGLCNQLETPLPLSPTICAAQDEPRSFKLWFNLLVCFQITKLDLPTSELFARASGTLDWTGLDLQ